MTRRHPLPSSEATHLVPPNQERAFRDFLQRRTGFVIPEGRWTHLAPKFFGRLKDRGFLDVHKYIHYLETSPFGRTELEEIFHVLTVRKTSFFRNPSSYMALINEVLPRLVRERTSRVPIALWSAGCSTGEEPYSLAIAATTALEGSELNPYVLATDIVKEALTTAREGSYPAASIDSVPPEFRSQFRVEGGRAWVAPKIRALVEFAEHNLVHQAVPRSAVGQWDVIFCRNVFIYFDLAQATEILRRFIATLAPGGALFLGHSEVFTEIEDELELVFWGETFYYHKLREAPPPAAALATTPPRVSSPPEQKTGAFFGPDDETRKFDYRSKPDAPQSDTSRMRISRLGDSPTRAIRQPLSTRRLAGPNAETRSWSRASVGNLPVELIHEAERKLRAKDPEGAARALRMACSRAPRWAKPRTMLAEIYVELEELDHAWTELQAAIGAEPLAFRAHYLLGTVHALRGDHTRAEVALRRSLYLEPDFATARFALGISLRALDQKQRACRELRSCLRSLRSMNPARLLTLTKGLPFPAKDLMGRCEQEIDEMGGTTQDSGIWRIPKKT